MFETRMNENFPPDPGSSENTSQDKCKKQTKKQLPRHRHNIFKKQGQQYKTVTDVVDINPTISIITLNITSLNIPIKDIDCQSGSKNKTTICCLQETLNIKTLNVD